MTDFEPKIAGFLCNWCCYAGADLAGVSRFQYPPNIRVIRVMCSGRIDPAIVFDAFLYGVDGVFIGGCHPGDCHYISGNLYAERKMKLAHKMLKVAGFEPGRLRLEWVSAAEGQRFAEVMKEFTEEIRALGPNTISKETGEELNAAKKALEDFRLRVLVTKEYQIVEEGNIYDVKKSQEEFDELMDSAIFNEFVRRRILKLTEKKPLSVKDLSPIINLDTKEILKQIVFLRKKNMLELTEIDNMTPKYTAITVGGE
jgi:coenzyme F420-reducing hydrogenase delta subunit